ncbi:hypothetical protein ACOMHN_026113 [Nucella lapillus]
MDTWKRGGNYRGSCLDLLIGFGSATCLGLQLLSFYWFINVGSLIAYTGVVYVQQEVSFFWGFVVPLVSMVFAILLFIAIKPFYIHTVWRGAGLVV